MVANNATQFLERLTNDSAFRAEFKTSAAGKVPTILDFALAKGFVFTEQDLKSALASSPSNPTLDQLREQLKVTKAVR